jgi:3-(3-hydroxy-phenyl)propionate hydroxylase
MIGLALMVGRAMTAGGRIGDLARRTIVPRMHLLPGLRERVIDSQTPALNRSVLVHRTYLPGELAGTLCPNAVLRDGRRFDDDFGNGFTVVVDRPLGPVERSLAESRGAVVHIAEPGGELEQWLRRGRAHAAVVRPDYTVLSAGRDVHKICASLPAAGPTAPR